MSRFDQAKTLMQVKKIQRQLEKEVITIEKGDGAVSVEITGEQKIKKIHIYLRTLSTTLSSLRCGWKKLSKKPSLLRKRLPPRKCGP